MSAISDNVGELTAAVKDKLVQHAERFREQNLRDEKIAPQDKYLRVLPHEQAFTHSPESYVIGMLSQRKISLPQQSVNPHCRYQDCPSYIDPTYYERIELRKKENPIRQDYALQVMPRLSSSDETFDEDILYLQEDEDSIQRNRINVFLGSRFLFTIEMDYSQEGILTQSFVDRNSDVLRNKMVAMGEYTLEYRDTLRDGRWQLANIAAYSALQNLPSLTADFLDENKDCIVVYLSSQQRGLPFRTYNANRILPGIWVGEGPKGNDYFNTFNDMAAMLVDFRVNTVIAVGPSQEGKHAKFYDYIKDQGKDGWPFAVQTENAGAFFCYHLNDWHDQKPCHNLSQLESALEIMRNANEQNPIFIHCSAGLGRSGVLATILYLPRYLKEHLPAEIITKLENDLELTMDEKDTLATVIAEGVIELRTIRPGLIRTEQQLAQAIDMGLSELKREAKCDKKLEGKEENPLFLRMRFLAPPAVSSSSAVACDPVSGIMFKPGNAS